jgi:hypothetical protein
VAAWQAPTIRTVIYCVVPVELADDLYERLVEYYKDNPSVKVIVERRSGPDRRERNAPIQLDEQRRLRERRRSRIPGTFLPTDPPQAA